MVKVYLIKIVHCSDKSYWYNDKIQQRMKVKKRPSLGLYQLYGSEDSDNLFIALQDVRIIGTFKIKE